MVKEGRIKGGRNVTEKMRKVRGRRECSREKEVEKRMMSDGMIRSRGRKEEKERSSKAAEDRKHLPLNRDYSLCRSRVPRDFTTSAVSR